MEDYELFSSCNMLRVDKGEKEEENECLKEYREAKEGKAVIAEGQNIQSKPRERQDPTVQYNVNRPRGKKRLHPSIKLVDGC